ncbi:MAG TPA: arsenate reductase [Bacteroidales bacterium]|nr:MAG: hypothetical protein A2X11_12045 [Bacteroidetes bacterium GWE2_42_24]OFY31065.1 MAG: hypothetical protein A2X09_16000 [Bacteroidetes bacterium GWF2_43_11]PKP27485.1 MAG: arsenate reductase [Bacteroidetes bacterium HGW-Bacteroidetes-22]HAQ64660.1 arsenate reductase [Bacteroidales bacterium]HBZ66560.1 arsenate reductase [Bacteroidales bacterium]
MLKIYHNPRCRKSRAGLEYVQSKTESFEVVDYLNKPLTAAELEVLIMKLGIKPAELVRTQEEYFKQNLKGKQFNDHEWIKILAENPKLIRRPIVESKYKAVVADPPEEAGRFFDEK